MSEVVVWAEGDGIGEARRVQIFQPESPVSHGPTSPVFPTLTSQVPPTLTFIDSVIFSFPTFEMNCRRKQSWISPCPYSFSF